LSHEPFLLVITQVCAGAGFNDSSILPNRSRAAIPPLLARCDGVDDARAASGSMKGRAKMVVVEATVCRRSHGAGGGGLASSSLDESD
jgi:hypothetical protein